MISARAFADDSATVTDAAQQRGPATTTSVASANLPLCTNGSPEVNKELAKVGGSDTSTVVDTAGRTANSADTQKNDPPVKSP